jgi:hypothetical protein
MLSAWRKGMNLSPSRLGNSNSSLVLDASVLLNLLGTGSPEVLLRNLGRACIIDEVAISEVHIHPITGSPCDELLKFLQTEELLRVVQMETVVYEHFISLTGASPPDDLDDGEAATIAQAYFNGWTAVLDERKATRIAMVCLPETQVLTSVDLLSAPKLSAALGEAKVADLLYFALRNARMRIPPRARSWVIETLGVGRVADCPSFGLARANLRTTGSK